MFAVEAVAADEAADTTHGAAGIGEEVQVVKSHNSEAKTRLMTPEKYSQ